MLGPDLMNLPDKPYMGMLYIYAYINALQSLLATGLMPVCPLNKGNLPSELRSNNMCYTLNEKFLSHLEVQSILAEKQNVFRTGT